MILIADSGSTKTDWRLIDDNKKIHQFATQGFNPYFQSVNQISESIKSELLKQIKSKKSPISEGVAQCPKIFFYGAGCGTDSNKKIIYNALLENFKCATIEVNTDLLGAARALCGNKPGIAAILGTGSNTCFYDGEKIVVNRSSLGYILGDEGSGAHIGKTFVQAYLNKEMPEELAARFYDQFKLSKDEIIDAVYRKPMPNRFLAAFSKFTYHHFREQFIIDMVVGCFEQFFDKHICKYDDICNLRETPMNCVGSVAFYHSSTLRAVARKKGIIVDQILETPITKLTGYHLGEV